ncbi:MAG: 3-hydroxyacyl-CoA dehydrogenase family protein [Planctomycetota bacterium]
MTENQSVVFPRVAVLGAGTMGAGIAQVCAQAGSEVVLRDVQDEFVARGMGTIRGFLDKGVEKGKVSVDAREATLGRLTTTTDLAAAVAGADLVVEAVPERLDLKREVFAAVAAAAPATAVLATNTSSLSLAGIFEGIAEPARCVGMHFFNPVPIMALLEIVRPDAASESTVERVRTYAAQIGKEPIVVRDSPGFATSRLGVCIGLEAIRMVEAGVASAADIDKAMELGYRHPMGPLRLTDLVGLDVRLAIADYLRKELDSPVFEAPQLLRDMVAAGKLGKKSGQGFYDWG